LHSFKFWTCENSENEENGEGKYNPLATLFLNTEKGTILNLFHASEYFKIELSQLIIFTAFWFIMTVTTYGVWTPAGLFLPGIIMGGAMGRVYTMVIH